MYTRRWPVTVLDSLITLARVASRRRWDEEETVEKRASRDINFADREIRGDRVGRTGPRGRGRRYVPGEPEQESAAKQRVNLGPYGNESKKKKIGSIRGRTFAAARVLRPGRPPPRLRRQRDKSRLDAFF